jgi:hypothetical protein
MHDGSAGSAVHLNYKLRRIWVPPYLTQTRATLKVYDFCQSPNGTTAKYILPSLCAISHRIPLAAVGRVRSRPLKAGGAAPRDEPHGAEGSSRLSGRAIWIAATETELRPAGVLSGGLKVPR